jgi:hypothetical protein
MFSNIAEAFNPPLKQQLDKLDKINNMNNHKAALAQTVSNYQQKNGLMPPHETNYLDYPYFTAQGDINSNNDNENENENENNNNNNNGTKLSDLAQKEINETESLAQDYILENDTLSNIPTLYTNTATNSIGSLGSIGSFGTQESNYDNNSTNRSFLTVKTKNKKKSKNVIHSHEYYIYRFLKELKKDDLTSLMGEDLDDVYDHVKICGFCKAQINKKLTSGNNKIVAQSVVPVVPVVEKKSKNEIKEIAVIIFIGIVVIFILDLFYKIYNMLKLRN